MASKYFSACKTLVVTAIVGMAANFLTNTGEKFGAKLLRVVFPSQETEVHEINFSSYATAQALLDDILKGDRSTEKVSSLVKKVFAFAKEEEIPIDCVPLLTLLLLEDLDITLIVDDSTSMEDVDNRRWEECRKLVSMVAQYGLLSDANAVSLRFLNHKEKHKIQTLSCIERLFARNPFGTTPLIGVLDQTMAEIKKANNKKMHLLYVFTDGIPSDGSYYEPTLTWIRKFFAPDESIVDKVAINFIVADTNPATEQEYERADEFIPSRERSLHIDTNLTYPSEKIRCANLLTVGLYKAKILLGAVNEDFDDLNSANIDHLMTKSLELRMLKNAWHILREKNTEFLVYENTQDSASSL